MHLPTERGFVNITPQVEEAVRESGVREGLVLVNSMHITSSVFINDHEPGLWRSRPGVKNTDAGLHAVSVVLLPLQGPARHFAGLEVPRLHGASEASQVLQVARELQ